MATIKDVAKEAGVAVETVSRVLNNRGYISEKTRHKVYLAMENLNYTPNTFARGLSKQDMGCIALIVPHVAHPYFSTVVSLLEREAQARGYQMLLFNSNRSQDSEQRILMACQNSFVSGVVLFSSDFRPDVFDRYRLPIVMVEREGPKSAYSILCDNQSGGRLAARHLLDKGCRDMVVITTLAENYMPGDLRSREFVEICRQAGLTVPIYAAGQNEYVAVDYYEVIRQALDEHPDCDGIFATADLIAAQVIQVSHERGRRVPEDVKVIGFDDTWVAKLISPRLTTIHQPIREMAAQAIEVFERLANNQMVPTVSILPVSLVERGST